MKKQVSLVWVVLLLAVMAIIGYIVTPKEVWEKQRQQKEAKQAELSKISQANFEKIQTGMTFDAVAEILGDGWKETSAVGTTQTYIWKGGVLKSITIVFENNRVYSKTSLGLR